MSKHAADRPAVERPEIPVDVAEHVLWLWGDERLGVEPGRFHYRLLRTIQAADKENRELLREIYPAHVHAFDMAFREPTWGPDALKRIVLRQQEQWAAVGLRLDAIADENDAALVAELDTESCS